MTVFPISHLSHIRAFSSRMNPDNIENSSPTAQECTIKKLMEGILPYDEWAKRNPGAASVTEEQEEALVALGERDLCHWSSYEAAQECINSSMNEQSTEGASWWQRRRK